MPNNFIDTFRLGILRQPIYRLDDRARGEIAVLKEDRRGTVSRHPGDVLEICCGLDQSAKRRTILRSLSWAFSEGANVLLENTSTRGQFEKNPNGAGRT